MLRQYDLWWHDLNLLIDAAQDGGSRPWVWSDYMWHHPEEFFENMPASVLQSNWYYDDDFNPQDRMVKAYAQLEEPRIRSGAHRQQLRRANAETCRRPSSIAPGHRSDRLFGFMQSTWRPTQEEFRAIHLDAIEQVARAREWYEGGRE